MIHVMHLRSETAFLYNFTFEENEPLVMFNEHSGDISELAVTGQGLQGLGIAI